MMDVLNFWWNQGPIKYHVLNGTKLSIFGRLGGWLRLAFDWKSRLFRWQSDCFVGHPFLNLVPLYDVPRIPLI